MSTSTTFFIDLTPPTVTLAAPALSNYQPPLLTVTASANSMAGLDSTVHIDVDLQHDGSFTDPGDQDFGVAQLQSGGTASFYLMTPLPSGVYNLQARVDDQVGNEGVSAASTMIVNPYMGYVGSQALLDLANGATYGTVIPIPNNPGDMPTNPPPGTTMPAEPGMPAPNYPGVTTPTWRRHHDAARPAAGWDTARPAGSEVGNGIRLGQRQRGQGMGYGSASGSGSGSGSSSGSETGPAAASTSCNSTTRAASWWTSTARSRPTSTASSARLRRRTVSRPSTSTRIRSWCRAGCRSTRSSISPRPRTSPRSIRCTSRSCGPAASSRRATWSSNGPTYRAQQGVDGSGTTVGIISDSVNQFDGGLADSVAASAIATTSAR